MSDAHSAVGSYVADALNPTERAEFEDHLAGCYRCRLEVAEYYETVAMLTPLVATSPPVKLRRSILAAIGNVHPLAADVTALSEERARLLAEHEPTDPRPTVPATVTELRPLGPDEVTPLEEHPSVLPDSSWVGVTASFSDDLGVHRSRRSDRILVALVAAALVVALAFSGWIYVSWQQDQTQVTQRQQENDVLTAPDARIYRGMVSGTAVSFVVSKELNKAVFIASDLPDLQGDRTYQLWTIKGQAAKSAGVVGDGGSVRQVIVGDVADADRIAVSNEPSPRGSSNPTPPVLLEVSI
jgi:anti-sigma factor RsiW